jgi:hypothetical protein
MPTDIVSQQGLLLLYYEERENFEHDEAVRRVSHFTGQSVETVQAVIDEESATA